MGNTVPDINKITQLQFLFGQLWDENFKLRDKAVYNSRIKSFNDELAQIGIDSKLAPKEIELKLQQLYELLTKIPKFKDANEPNDVIKEAPRPKVENATTLTPQQLQDLTEQAEKTKQQKARIEAREKQAVQDYVDTQQKIREQIAKVQSIQEEVKNKKIFAKVEVDPKDVVQINQLKPEEIEKIKHYEALVEEGKLETAAQELAIEIEQKIEQELAKEGITKSEAKIIAIETAHQAIEELSHKKEPDYTPPAYQTAIIATVASDNKVLPKIIASKTAEELIKTSASNVAIFRIQPEVLTRSVLTTALGERFSTFVLGVDPTKVRVILSETIPQNLNREQLTEYREVSPQAINSNSINIQQDQINVLERISGQGREVAGGYVQSNVVNYFARQIEKLPAESVIKKVVSTPEMQAVFFAKFGMGSPVTWQYMNPVLMRVMGQNQLAGAAFSAIGKATGKQIVVPILSTATTQVAGQVATQVAVKKGAAGLIAKVITFFAGAPAGPAGWIASLAIGEVVGKAVENLTSRLKVWWTEHKKDFGPAIVTFVTGGALLVGGPTAGAMGLGLSLWATGMLRSFLIGGVGVLGIIGRNIGITIATPVIVTLLVLPPLVAFIMLVINNSAYVVPPGLSSSSLNGGADNPYMLVTKTANPTKLDNSNSNQTVIYVVSIKALKGNLTNLKLVSTECSVVKKDKSKVECPTEFVSDLDGASISPGNDGVFSFTGIYGPKYSDSLIYDRITISATNEAGEEVVTSGSASVCVGDCPRGCFEISNENEQWPSGYSSTLAGAIGDLVSKFPEFVDKACVGRQSVKLCYTSKDPSPVGKKGLCNEAIYAITSQLSDSNNGCVINFNQCGVRGDPKDAFFLLTHEVSHHIAWRDGGNMISNYINSGAQHELPLCSYSGTQGNPYEGSAEANALYATGGTASFSTCSMNFQSQYPRNYSYAQEYMNNP